MSRLLNRLGNTAAHKRWLVIGAWVIAIVLATTAVKTLGANTSNNLELPGTDSQAASDLLAARFPPQQNGANPIVFKTASGKVADEANKKAIDEAHKAILAMPTPGGCRSGPAASCRTSTSRARAPPRRTRWAR